MVILVVALIVLGPDKLPGMARKVGALWSDFHRWRASIEREVRDTFPDLPPTAEIARAIRSPLALLDKLAQDAPGDGEAAARATGPPAAGGGDTSSGPPRAADAVAHRADAPVPGGAGTQSPPAGPLAVAARLDAPSLN